jgi:hypothetical protein
MFKAMFLYLGHRFFFRTAHRRPGPLCSIDDCGLKKKMLMRASILILLVSIVAVAALAESDS